MTSDEHKDAVSESGFAPNDPSDGRDVGHWKTRYLDDAAKRAIRCETIVLVFLFLMALIIVFTAWAGWLARPLGLSTEKYQTLAQYIYGSAGGLFGGTIFSIKWLYHSVSRGIWHIDRRLWRFLTPLVSVGLALVTLALMKSGLLSIFDKNGLDTGSQIFSVGFLVGYFSDSAVAKFAQIAQTLFGVSPPPPRKPPSEQNP